MATTPEHKVPLFDNASVVNPVQTPLNTLANGVENALVAFSNSVSTVVANVAERDAKFPSPLQGDRVWRNDLGYEETYWALRSSTNPGGADAAGWYPSWNSYPGLVNVGRITPKTDVNQAGITGRTTITGSQVNVTLGSAATLRFNFQITTYSTSPSDVVNLTIMQGSNAIADFSRPANSSPTLIATSYVHTLTFEKRIAAGAHTFALAVGRAAGPGTITVHSAEFNPLIFSIDRIG